jgi:diphosphomevalonate decarboxylase
VTDQANSASKTATAIAHPNIALSKYWGKQTFGHNLPAVPSLSLTLRGMQTKTTVAFDAALAGDAFELNGQPAEGVVLQRVTQMLDRVRSLAGSTERARVVSSNDFPTASGLASSASAFAALATAATHALGLQLSREVLSDLARRISVSAARSLFGGFVELRAGVPSDEQLSANEVAGPDFWDVAIVVAVTREGAKDVGSSDGMKHTRDTSPYYQAWVDSAPATFAHLRAGLLERDLTKMGPAIEQSALSMHAGALAANPAILYFSGATVEVIHAVRKMRASGLEGYLTIDAGPHVKVFTRGADAERVAAYLASVPGVLRTITARPGAGATAVANG